jgi:hypothetical protein
LSICKYNINKDCIFNYIFMAQGAEALPSQDVMVSKLREAGLYGTDKVADQVYDAFVDKIAGKAMMDVAINMAWEKALQKIPTGEPVSVTAALELQYPRALDAVILDPELAAAAKLVREEVRAMLREESGS